MPSFGAGSAVMDESTFNGDTRPVTWDSLGEVGESNPAPTRPTKTPTRSRPIADFGFTGTFVSEDTVLAGSLEVKKNKVTLWASGTQLASWKSSDCKVRRLDGDRFSIEADDEMITFTADDPDGLIDAVSAFLSPQAVLGETSVVREAAPEPRTSGMSENLETEVEANKEPVARVTESPTPREPEPSRKPEPPTQPQLSAPPIRRPRIKAFEAKLVEAETIKGGTEGAHSKSSGLAAYNISPAAPAKSGAAPVVDSETEPVTIADRITATAKRRYKSTKAHRWLKSDIENVAIKTGVVASAAGIITLAALAVFVLVGGFRGEPEFVPVPTTTIPPTPTTTVVVTTLPPPPTTLFETDPAELTDRWNALAERSRTELTMFTDLTSPFLLSLTPYMTLEGFLDPAAGSVVIRSTPTGTPEGDGLILTSLGLMIGMADPSLDGSDRRLLLETLGLTIQDPQLGGLDGTVNYNGLTYHLIYLSDLGVLEFRITPEGQGPSETTTSTAP